MSTQQRLPVVLVALGSALLALNLWLLARDEPLDSRAATGVAEVEPRREAVQQLEAVAEASAPAEEPQRHEAPPAVVATAPERAPKVFLAGEVNLDGRAEAGVSVRVARQRTTRVSSLGNVRGLGASAPFADVSYLRPSVLGARYSSDYQGRTDERGSFRIDITRLVLTEPPPALAIEVQRDGALPVEFELEVEVDSTRWGREAEHELRAVLLVPTTCDVVGRISAAWIDPLRIHARPAASVAVFELLDGRPAVSALQTAACERSTGQFGLHLECGREYVFVALVEGFRPWSRVIAARGFSDLGELVLERGESIAGRAHVDQTPVRGAVRARLRAASARENLQCCIAGRWLVWTGAGFEWESQGVATADDGRFEISGLAASSYSLELGAVSNAYASSSALVEVAAPARGVELSSRVCRVDLQVFQEGSPAAHRSLEISEVGGSAMTIGTHRTDASGVATLWVDPSRKTSVALVPTEGDLTGGAKPSRRIECHQPGRAVSMRVDF